MQIDLIRLKDDLEKKYQTHRVLIPNTLSDEELIKNEDFKKCFLINNILQLFQKADQTELEILGESFDFNSEKIIENLELEISLDNNSKEFKYTVKSKDDEPEPGE